MKFESKYLLPTIAVIAGGLGAWLMKPTSSPSTAAYSAAAAMPVTQGNQASGVHGEAEQHPTDDRISGKVLETITVPNYTYLRLAPTGGTGDVWAADATADVKVGQLVAIVGTQRMEKFTSSTLKRTFEAIYFGALEGGTEAAGGKLPAGHPDIGAGAEPARTDKLPAGHPDVGAGTGMASAAASAALPANGVDPMLGGSHGSPTAGGNDVPIGKVERAPGELGHTVAEVVDGRTKLVGKAVRVRGVVVKSTSGVLGKTFVHLRDGSGNAAAGDHDLTATINQEAAVGSTLLLEGTVVTDKDFGAGYTYRVLLEDAHTVGK